MPNLEQLVSRQIERWEMERGSWVPQPAGPEEPPKPRQPVIAIMPDLGCGSRHVIDRLSRLMGYEIYGFKLIDKVAENMNVRRMLIDRMDQRQRSVIRTMVEGLLSERYVDQQEYFSNLAQVLRVFIIEGGSILLGRGAPFLVRRGEGLRVRLTASREKRIANLTRFYKISEEEAQERMETSDRERRKFHKTYFDKDIDDIDSYDLCINLDRVTHQEAAGVIMRHLDVISCDCDSCVNCKNKIWMRNLPLSAEDAVQRKIEQWEHDEVSEQLELAEASEPDSTKKTKRRDPSVAFMARFCCGSRLVAEELYARKRFEIFGYKLIDQVAEDMNLSPRIIDRLDHVTRGNIKATVDALLQGRRVSREKYFRSLVQIVRALVVQGGVILLGRGTPFLIEPDEGLRVRLTAPLQKRLENFTRFYGIGGAEAEERLIKGEKERRGFIEQYFRANIDDPKNYDLTINMERVSPVVAADVIQRALDSFYE